MSVRVLSCVLGAFHEDSDPADRLVLVVLADAAHDDGVTWVSQDQIAEQSRLSTRHVRRCLRELADRNEIQVRKAQRGHRRINIYRVVGAPKEVDYTRLPFAIDVPFETATETTGHHVRSGDGKESDDRTFRTETTGHLAHISEPTLSIGPVSRTRNTHSVELSLAAPKLTKIDGRDVAFDALAEVCGIRPKSPRLRHVAVALNAPGGKPENGIRAQFAHDHPPDGDLAAWERQLAADVRERAEMYQQKMPGATLTPGALAKWWTDLPRLANPRRGGAPSPEELMERAQRLQEQGR